MNQHDANGKDQGTSVEVLEERVHGLRDAVTQLAASVKDREDSSEGMRVRVADVEAKIDSHEKVCAARWGELTGSLKTVKWGLGVLLTMVSVVIALLGVLHLRR